MMDEQSLIEAHQELVDIMRRDSSLPPVMVFPLWHPYVKHRILSGDLPSNWEIFNGCLHIFN